MLRSIMRPALPKPFAGIVLSLMLALTMGLVGFGHRAPSLTDEALAAYALQGIALADLCGDDGTGLHGDGSCPACHIAGSIALPSPVAIDRDVEFRFVAEVVAPRESRALRVVLDPAHGTRAPPAA